MAGPARPQSKPRQPDRIAYAVQQPLLERLVLHVVVQGVGVAKVEVGHLHDEAFPVLDVVGDAEHHQNHRQQAEPDRDDDDRELRFGLIFVDLQSHLNDLFGNPILHEDHQRLLLLMEHPRGVPKLTAIFTNLPVVSARLVFGDVVLSINDIIAEAERWRSRTLERQIGRGTLLNPLRSGNVQFGDWILHRDLPHEMTVGFLRIRRDHRTVATNERLPRIVNVEAGIGLLYDTTYRRSAVGLIFHLLQKMFRYPFAVQDDTSYIGHVEQQWANTGEDIAISCC